MDDFEAALAAKLEASPDEETTPEVEEPPVVVEDAPEEELPEAEVDAEQPRDEKGRFAAKERPEWLPQQFKSEEDFAKSYAELQKVLGRQGEELGELRKLAEQIRDTPASPQVPAGDIEEDPERVAYAAAQAGDERLLERALTAWQRKAWEEDDWDGLRSAQRFERELDIARLKYEFSQEVTPSIEQVRAEAGKRALAVARRELEARYPDFNEVLDSVQTDPSLVDGLDPKLLGELQKADPLSALETVYRWAAVGVRAKSSADKEADKAEATQRKREAQVATATSAPATREKSAVETFKELILQPEAHSVHHGLSKD